jgi:hypothetical protein
MDPTDDQIKAEIRAAAEILRSDHVLKHTRDTSERLSRLEARFGGDDDGTKADPKLPPPAKDEPAAPPASKKPGLWWGDAL